MDAISDCTICRSAVDADAVVCTTCSAEFRYKYGFDFNPEKTVKTGNILYVVAAFMVAIGFAATFLGQGGGPAAMGIVFGLVIAAVGATKVVSGRAELKKGRRWWKVPGTPR